MQYTVDTLTPADDELLVEILQVLSKRHGIRFAVAPPWQPQTETELQSRVVAADAQPRLSFAEARERLGL